MTGFLRSLLIRGAGPSAAGQAQFATVAARPRFAQRPPRAVSAPSPAREAAAEGPISKPFQPPAEKAPPAAPTLDRHVRQGVPAVETVTRAAIRAIEAQGLIRPPTEAIARASPAPGPAGPPVSTRTEQAVSPKPTKDGREHDTAAIVARAPEGTPLPDPFVDAVDVVTLIAAEEAQRKESSAAMRPRQPPQSVQKDTSSAAGGTTIEIGHIEIVIAPSPQSNARSEPDRMRGFAGYEQRRLGPRR